MVKRIKVSESESIILPEVFWMSQLDINKDSGGSFRLNITSMLGNLIMDVPHFLCIQIFIWLQLQKVHISF